MTLDIQKLRATALAAMLPSGAAPRMRFHKACSPDVILQLLDALEAMTAERDRANQEYVTMQAVLKAEHETCQKLRIARDCLADVAVKYIVFVQSISRSPSVDHPTLEKIAALRAVGGAK